MNRRMRLLTAALAAGILLAPTTATGGSQQMSSIVSKPGISADTTRAVQLTLKSFGYTIVVDGVYGKQTTAVVRSWQRSNGLVVDGVVGPQTLDSLDLTGGADASVPATRTNPPTGEGLSGLPFAPAGLSGCAEMNWYRVQANLPDQFSDQPRTGPKSQWGFGWRESNCDNTVGNSCCGGYYGNYITSHLSSQSAYRERIINECQVSGMSDIRGPSPLQKQKQMCVTYVVWSISGLSPWHL